MKRKGILLWLGEIRVNWLDADHWFASFACPLFYFSVCRYWQTWKYSVLPRWGLFLGFLAWPTEEGSYIHKWHWERYKL